MSHVAVCVASHVSIMRQVKLTRSEGLVLPPTSGHLVKIFDVIQYMASYLKYANRAATALRAGKDLYDEARPYVDAISSGLKRLRTTSTSKGVGRRSSSLGRAVRRHFRGRRKRSYRVIRRRSRRYRKIRRLKRLVPPMPRKTVYQRRRKGIRRGNQGMLSLQYRLQSGSTLPEQTFARVYYRGSSSVHFRTLVTDTPSNQQFKISVGERTFVLNDISGSPWNENSISNNMTDNGLAGVIMYKSFWESIYRQYMVLGAKMKICIRPTVYPSQVAQMINASPYGSTVPMEAQPGYYYARVYYHRAMGGGSTSVGNESVGYPIRNQAGQDDPGTENYWPHLRDFLSDNTVTWKKDRTSLRTKIHVHRDLSLGSTTGTSSWYPSSGASYELETSNRNIYLNVNFSAKKNFMTKDILVNGTWNTWDTQLDDMYRFYVRFGYIGFNQDGNVAYHIPIDRGPERSVSVDISYFIALRDPLITPTMYEGWSDRGIKALAMQATTEVPEGISEVDEDEVFSDDETDSTCASTCA